jgi:hypothetical protein
MALMWVAMAAQISQDTTSSLICVAVRRNLQRHMAQSVDQ